MLGTTGTAHHVGRTTCLPTSPLRTDPCCTGPSVLCHVMCVCHLFFKISSSCIKSFSSLSMHCFSLSHVVVSYFVFDTCFHSFSPSPCLRQSPVSLLHIHHLQCWIMITLLSACVIFLTSRSPGCVHHGRTSSCFPWFHSRWQRSLLSPTCPRSTSLCLTCAHSWMERRLL